MSQLEVMGGLRLIGSGFTQPKPLVLLAYLAWEGPQPKRRVAELFWPGGQAGKSLSMALTRLHHGAGPVVASDARRAWATVACDAVELRTLLDQGAVDRASALYRGAFLDGIKLDPGNEELEEWVLATREALAESVRQVLLQTAERSTGSATAGIAERAWRLPGAAPAEPGTLVRVLALLEAARHPRAAAVRRELAEYGEDDPAPSSIAVPTPRPPTNLQLIATPFVGRDAEATRLGARLAGGEARWTTLMGPGGVGKTRLALEVARAARDGGTYPGGVFWSDVADPAPDALPRHLLGVIGGGVRVRPDAWAHLAEWLGGRRVLWVIDDLDRHTAALADLTDLLDRVPGLDLLVTARSRLGPAAEVGFALAGLAVPEAGTPWPEASRQGAVRLLVERASLHPAAIPLAPQVADVIALCRVLDGSPLALELVAPWTRLAPCAELLDRLQHDAGSLDSSEAALPTRQRTLRGVFETAWALLDDDVRAVARGLGAFHGAFRLADAAEVAGATLPALARLADAAFVRGANDGRYTLHPLVAGFLRARLDDDTVARAAAERRLRDQVLTWLASLRAAVAQGRQEDAFRALGERWADVVAVIGRAIDASDVPALAALLELTDVTFEARGAVDEGRRTLARIVTVLEGLPSARRPHARAAVELAWLDYRGGAFEASARAARSALDLAEALGESAVAARACMILGQIEGAQGRRTEGRPWLTRALDLARASGDSAAVAGALGSLAINEAELGRLAASIPHFEEALALHRRDGRILSTIREAGNLAITYGQLGDLERSGALLEEGLAAARAIGFRQTLPYTLSNLAVHYERLGNLDRALAHDLEALAVAQETGQRSIQVPVLVHLAGVRAALGDGSGASADVGRALVLAHDLRAEPLQVQALEACADLARRLGRTAWAARLLRLIGEHPAARSYVGGHAMASWRDLRRTLSLTEVREARRFASMTPLADALRAAIEHGANGPPELAARSAR